MTELIGYARVSTKAQDTDRQIQDLRAARARHDDLYINQGRSGALTKRPGLDKALDALQPDDNLVITTLDQLGRSTQKILDLAEELRTRNIELRILNLGGDVDTKTPTGAMVFTAMAALAQMELEIKSRTFTNSQIRHHTAPKLIQAVEPATQIARDIGMSRVTPYRRIKEHQEITEN
ncbi:recombinase family protein [Glutamicibacter sp.]|uniref:recombinase family protein n=1 Tax=Glutamicibacter sp. TaxID=1931995 RepID=UPI002B46673C|nr:recombinase family protein [Glutamicibacter sp.]HJX78139.1 recombinase family protein [Glutamicibacter sp.]